MGSNGNPCAPPSLPLWGAHAGVPQIHVDMALHYGLCEGGHGEDSELAFSRLMLRLEVRSDASFGPAGGRGHQGLIAMYGGCPIQ